MRVLSPEEARQADEQMVSRPIVVHPSGETYVPPDTRDAVAGLIEAQDGRLMVPDLRRVPSGETDVIAIAHDTCDIIDEVADTMIKRGRRHFAMMSDGAEEKLTEGLILTKGIATGIGYITRAMHHAPKVRRAVNQTFSRVSSRVTGEASRQEIQAYDRLYNVWRIHFHQPYSQWMKDQLGAKKYEDAVKNVKGNKQIWGSTIEESFNWMTENSGWAISEENALELTTKFLIDAFADEGAQKSSLIDMFRDGDIAPPKIRPQDRERAKRSKAARLPKSRAKDLASEIKKKKGKAKQRE